MHTYKTAESTIPPITSIKECCFINTVDAHIRIITNDDKIFILFLSINNELSQIAIFTPIEFITCILGKTFVDESTE